MNHEDVAAEAHEMMQERTHHDTQRDMTGGSIARPSAEVKAPLEKIDYDDTADGDEPNDEEKRTLRRIGENLPMSTFLIAVVELCERFTYYGASGLFQNYISNSASGVDGPAGLGLGHQGATGLNVFFQFFCYVTPILGAIIADQYLGKYKTILLFCGVYWVGLVILWTTALPVSVQGGSALGGYVASIIIIGFGTGGIKSNIAPMIADQYQRHKMAIRTEPSGERIVIDPAITYQRIYMIFYWSINVGALSLLATPFMEMYEGFWTAYLMCFIMFNVGIAILVLRRKTYVNRPPQGQVITDAFKAIGLMIASRDTNAAKPTWRSEHGKTKTVAWNDHFVEELKRALRACKVFVFYPVFWICYSQFSSNFVSQAGQMEGHGMPNDLMQNFDPISILIFIPIIEKGIYPLLRKAGFELRPIARITIGFWFAALCLMYAAIVQHLIYAAGPCYKSPLECDAALVDGEKMPNHVHIAVQTPAYVFIGLAEIFISVTGLEYAYTKAPVSMKSFVQSLYLLTNAFGSALNEALVPVVVDPKILWMFTSLAVVAFITGFAFYGIFRHYDKEEDEMYDLDRDQPAIGRDGAPEEDKLGREGSV